MAMKLKLITCSILLSASCAVAVAPAQAKVSAVETAMMIEELERLDAEGDASYEGNTGKRDLARSQKAWNALLIAAKKAQAIGIKDADRFVGFANLGLAEIAQGNGQKVEAFTLASEAERYIKPFRETHHNRYLQSVLIVATIIAEDGKPSLAAATLDEAKISSDRYIAQFSGPLDPSIHMARSNLGYSLGQIQLRLGNLEQSMLANRSIWESRREAFGENKADTIAGRYQYALSLFRMGREQDAEREARTAVAQVQAHVLESHPSYYRALETLALILARTGRPAEASALVEQSIAVKKRTIGTNHFDYAFALATYGDLALQRERYAESRTAFEDAATRARAIQGKDSGTALRSDTYASVAAYAAGEADARGLLEAVFAEIRKRDANERQLSAEVVPALILARYDAGDISSAHILATDFLKATPATPNRPASINAEAAALEAFSAPRDVHWLAKAAATARVLVSAVRDEGWLQREGQLSFRARSALELALRIVAETGDHDTGLDAMTLLTGSRYAAVTRLLAARQTLGDPALAAQVDALEQAAVLFRSAETALARSPGSEKLAAQRDTAKAAAETARGELTTKFPAWTDSTGRAFVSVRQLQAGLTADQAILGVVPALNSVFIIVATPRSARLVRSGESYASTIAAVGKLRTAIATGEFRQVAGKNLTHAILPQTLWSDLSRTSELRIVTSGPIASVPFASLPTGREADQLWIDQFAVSSAALFTGLVNRDQTKTAQKAFLGVAAPTPFGEVNNADLKSAKIYFRGGTANVAELAQLPVLAASDKEVRTIARAFATKMSLILTADKASEDELRAQDLTRFSTILFATHGLVSGEMEGVTQPALVLAKPPSGATSDGLLTASEIAGLKLSADWVILSACNTAAGQSGDAPAFSGLAQAFRGAGARALLLSHWPVRDDVAARVTVRVMKEVKNGKSNAQALRRALLAERRRSQGDSYLWAPFVLAE